MHMALDYGHHVITNVRWDSRNKQRRFLHPDTLDQKAPVPQLLQIDWVCKSGSR